MTEAEVPSSDAAPGDPADDVRRQLEDELVQAQKMEAIGKLVSGLAHELNNPLAAILGFSQLIARDERLPEELRDDAALLVEEARKTKHLVDTVLEFVRHRPSERHPTNLQALVQAVLELEAYALGANRIDVHVDVAPDLPAIPIDRSRMQQALLGLVQNAIEALETRAGPGRITITATAGADPAGAVILAVADDGPGIAPEHRGRIFEPFFTTHPPGTATGLGLTVARRIVRDHGGDLRLDTAADQPGATFVAELPTTSAAKAGAANAATDAAAPPGDASAPAGVASATAGAPAANSPTMPTPAATSEPARRRVLVVDDEPAIRRFLAKVLESAGFEAVVAEDGRQALDAAADGRIDAVLCDHQMPGLSGTAVYDAIATTQPALAGRFVLMSGDVDHPDLLAFATPRGIGLLAKPFDIPAVTAAVRRALGAPVAGGG